MMDFASVATLLLMIMVGALCSYIGYCAGKEDGEEQGYEMGYSECLRHGPEYFVN